MNQLNYCWRWLATAFAFAVFFVGGLIISIIALPLIRLRFGYQPAAGHAARNCIRLSFKLFVGLLKLSGILSYEIHNRNRLEKPGALIVANHPTLLDIVFLISALPSSACIVKVSMINNWFVGRLMRAAGYISNADPQQSIEQGANALKEGISLVIFPEGTRSNHQSPTSAKLQRGAAYIALATQRNLTPVRISCEPPTLSKQEAWYQIPARKMHYVFAVLEEISVAGYCPEDTSSLAARDLTREIRTALLT